MMLSLETHAECCGYWVTVVCLVLDLTTALHTTKHYRQTGWVLMVVTCLSKSELDVSFYVYPLVFVVACSTRYSSELVHGHCMLQF